MRARPPAEATDLSSEEPGRPVDGAPWPPVIEQDVNIRNRLRPRRPAVLGILAREGPNRAGELLVQAMIEEDVENLISPAVGLVPPIPPPPSPRGC